MESRTYLVVINFQTRSRESYFIHQKVSKKMYS